MTKQHHQVNTFFPQEIFPTTSNSQKEKKKKRIGKEEEQGKALGRGGKERKKLYPDK